MGGKSGEHFFFQKVGFELAFKSRIKREGRKDRVLSREVSVYNKQGRVLGGMRTEQFHWKMRFMTMGAY